MSNFGNRHCYEFAGLFGELFAYNYIIGDHEQCSSRFLNMSLGEQFGKLLANRS